MNIRCITFDLDDTLWDCKPVIMRAEQRFYDWLANHFPAIAQHYAFDELLAHRMEFMKAHPQLRHDLTQLRKNWIERLAREADYNPAQMVEPGFEIFWLARNEVEFFAGVLAIIERLKQRYITGVISNGNADVHHIGVGHLFDFAISAEKAGVAKPHPDIFLQAVRKADVKPEQVVHIGDDPVTDVLGAREAGLKTVWVNLRQAEWQHEHEPHAAITALHELESTLEDLQQDLQQDLQRK